MKELNEQNYINLINSGEIDLRAINSRYYTDKICMAAVKKSGRALFFIENQTEELCLTAVRQDGSALEYVENQTHEICLAAVTQNGLALQYVEKQTEEICLTAVKNKAIPLKIINELYRTSAVCFELAVRITEHRIFTGCFDRSPNGVRKFKTNHSDIVDALKYLDDKDLVKFFKSEYGNYYVGDILKESDELYNLKQKVELLNSLDGEVEINKVNTKNKII